MRLGFCTLVHAADSDTLVERWPAGAALQDALVVDQHLHGSGNGPAEAERQKVRWKLRVPVLLVSRESDKQPLREAGHRYTSKRLAPERLAPWLASVQLTATTRDRP